jgi:hypothetical protein
MSDLDAIQSVLKRATRRRRWERAWNGLWQGLFVGASIWLATLAAFKLAPIPSFYLIAAGFLALLCLLGGFLSGWTRRESLQQTARCLDKRQNLQERMSTALEVAGSGPDTGWRALLVSDAARFAAKLDPRKIFPYRLPRISRWTLLLLVLGAGLGFVPEFRSQDYRDKQQASQAIHEAGRRIVEITHQALEHRPPALEPTRQALETVEQTGLRLDKVAMTRNEALKDLANASEKLKAQLQDLGKKNPALKAVERAAREQASNSAKDAATQKQTDDKSPGQAGQDSAALDKLAEQMQQLEKAAAAIPKDNSPEAVAARQKMAQSLSDLAAKARAMGQPLPDLDAAIAALQSNQPENFQRDLDLATTDLEKVQQISKELQRLQQQADRAGKDLPEQLKFGQPDQARQSLEKMIDQLRSGKISDGEAAKMLDEVSRAVEPAAPYGDASRYLQQAAEQLRNASKTASSESLAAAAKELEKIQSELADAKALQGSLDALNKAEISLATHRGWGECPTCGDSTGRCLAAGRCLGLGKGPGGHGVGAWTDDDSQLYPEMSGLWDNSGIDRPDRDPRGLTDRGDPQLSDNLAATKVHGQITPGGPMPAITLKGVSIKGQSAVNYTEAVQAAQSDAQSALNQDQVPRAYQGAVRDYFDDLKK